MGIFHNRNPETTKQTRQCAVSCRDLKKSYGEVQALRGVSFDVWAGELAMVVGPSGCGKTTLISVITGLLKPSSGQVELFGHDWLAMGTDRQTKFRRKRIGFVFQRYHLLPSLSAAENAAVPLVVSGVARKRAISAAGEILDKLGMSTRASAKPSTLSGGQQQRVAIARALIHEPSLLICDEPTAALDAESGQTVMSILRENARLNDRAVVVVTHDPRILSQADQLIEMEDGIIKQGRTAGEGITE